MAGGVTGVLTWSSIYPLDVVQSRLAAHPQHGCAAGQAPKHGTETDPVSRSLWVVGVVGLAILLSPFQVVGVRQQHFVPVAEHVGIGCARPFCACKFSVTQHSVRQLCTHTHTA